MHGQEGKSLREESGMNNKDKKYLGLVFVFSTILFGFLGIFLGTREPVRDYLLTILVVSYVLKNIQLDR